MKRITTLLLIFTLFVSTIIAGNPIKIACVGNSITFGAGIKERETNSYPAQLQSLLGDDYEVRNLGVNSRTALSKGNFPYIETPQYKESLSFEPDIVMIKLGTNDSKEHNFVHIADFERDYQAIIDSYKSLPSNPRIILITPLKCFGEPEKIYTISNDRLVKSITPIIEKLAYANNVELIYGYPLCGTDYDAEIMPDKLHPSAKGAGMMARHFADVITASRDEKYSIFDKLDGGKPFDFYGYSGRNYTIDGVECKVVQPHKPNKSHKWVIRARFWGHQPQLDRRLLEMGYHITYCDVAALFGSDEAVERWNRFHKLMTKSGLSRKVVLEGMSRGGLIVYNWAAQNPQKVEAIYADAPVLDLKSWPFGYPKYKREQQQALKAYGLDMEGMMAYRANPLDHAETIAKAKIPIIHVVGADDDVVPVADNTARLAELLSANGLNITIISKPGVGHHPHSLQDPTPIADFILKSGE